MSMGGGGGGTTTTKTEPWDAQKDYLKTGFSAANSLFSPWINTTPSTEAVYSSKLYLNPTTETYEPKLIKKATKGGDVTGVNLVNNALAPAYYQGNTVAPQSTWTKQALQMQANAAKNMASNPVMKAANSAAQQVASGQTLKNNAGLSQLQSLAKSAPVTQQQALGGNAGMTALNKYATQNFNGGNAALKNLQGTTGAGINSGNAALTQLNELAQNDNPYMDALYQRANNQAQASLDSNFNRAGRYGSGAHEAAAADAANNLADQMYSNLYNQRINAANAASGAYLQGMGEGINAQQAAGNLYNQGLGMNINAAQGAGQLYNTGIGNLINAYGQQANAAQGAGSLYNQGVGQRVVAAGTGQQLAQQPYTDAAMLSEAGGVKDDYQQQLINAAIDRYNYEAQRPLQALSTYNQLISGSYGGTSTAQGQQASGSRLGSALGGALTGGGIGAALSGASGAAALASPWGIGGAVLGGMLGLL